MVRQIVQRSHATASTCRSGNEGGGARFADPGDPARNGRAHGRTRTRADDRTRAGDEDR